MRYHNSNISFIVLRLAITLCELRCGYVIYSLLLLRRLSASHGHSALRTAHVFIDINLQGDIVQ